MTSNTLEQEYFLPSSKGSYGGVNRLKRLRTDLSSSQVNDFLQTQEVYTKTKQIRNKFLRRKVMVPCKNYLWQIDLVILPKLKRFNNGYAYILNCIDAFSRYAFSVPIKKKTGTEVCEAFKKILSSGYGSCKYIESDLGTEFKNKQFQELLDKNNIKIYSNFSDKGACIVERYNRTLMTRVYKYMLKNRTKKYVDVLQDIVNSYNNSYHRTIKCAPGDVDEYNEPEVWRNIYKDLIEYQGSQKPAYSVGDYARVKQSKGTFSKGYEQNFSDQCYKISEIINSIPITYRLSDGDGNILGIFYKEELSKVILQT